jgi:N-acyl-D-amino-acid deacylase
MSHRPRSGIVGRFLWSVLPLGGLLVFCGLEGTPLAQAGPPAPQKEAPGEEPLSVTGDSDPRLEAFDKALISAVRANKVPGAALAVTRHGKLVYARGFGVADRESGEPVRPDSLFRIASLSKPLTAVAILQLVEGGRLKLDDRVAMLLEVQPHLEAGAALDPRLSEVTVLHLLQHTGGWDSSKSFDPMFRPLAISAALGTDPPPEAWQIIRYQWGRPLDFTPGERYAYSNFGYCLLGRIIEKISGQSYESYVREHVLAPVGATATRLGKTDASQRLPLEVRYYDEQGRTGKGVIATQLGKEVPLPYGTWSLETLDANGGWVSSAIDLVRFASAFDAPSQSPLLKSESIATMFARPPRSRGGECRRHPEGRQLRLRLDGAPRRNGRAGEHMARRRLGWDVDVAGPPP